MAPKMGLVVLVSRYELGGDRCDGLLAATKQSLTEAGIEVVSGERSVENVADALAICDQFKNSGITSLAIVDATWQSDSLKYLFTQELGLPTLYWATPYPETLSIACVQHFSSILKLQNIPFQYVYGLPYDEAAVNKAVLVAKAGHILDRLANARVALVGPRNYWRIAGAMDMVNEEWEFSKKFGTTIVHLEMEEITDIAQEVSDDQARNVLEELASRTGKVNANDETLLWSAKVYLGTKAIVEKYKLDVVVGECYPRYSGLLNLAASWLGDEGLVVETEGDLSGAVVQYVLNTAAAGDEVANATILAEAGNFDDENNHFNFAHEGSTATAYAEDINEVRVEQLGDDGTQVCFRAKPMEKVTVCSLVGSAGQYKMLVANASTVKASQEEWDAAGIRLYAKLRFNEKPSKIMDTAINEGVGHHWLIKEGDYAGLVQVVCDYLQVGTLRIR
ncbi:hypothetical protein ACIQTZ_17995 [Paenarthrobacter sp. NPDC090520]|uniref:hypothetical protein n=1 Tax=Paenarthrobacter sp. NPDC090520 TaxID=3364382 RepID=UPI0038029932